MAKLGTLLDRLLAADVLIKKAEKEVKKAKAAYAKIESEVFDEFDKEDIAGAMGRVAQATLTRPVYPSLKDYESFERFVYRNRALDLLQRRVHKTNWLDRLDVRKGRAIPGVETFQKTVLSVKQRRR